MSVDTASERTSAAGRAYQYLRTRILEGAFQPGEHLKENEVAAALGVSRTPIREAIRRLDSDGWVELVPDRGAFVTTWAKHDLEEIFGLRTVLESYAAELAASRITDEEVDELDQLAQEMDRVLASRSRQEHARITSLNNRFHNVLRGAARNERLASMLRGLIEMPLVQRTFRNYDDDRLRHSLMEHHELVAAMRARDPVWASHIMSAHILGAARVFDVLGAT